MSNFVLHELTDDELKGLNSEDVYRIGKYYDENPLPYLSTIEGLMDSLGVQYDDLTDFILGLDVGVCNSVNRTDSQIYINRKNSPFKDNILINLDDSRDMPDVTVQIQVSDDFIHEEAYTKDGGLLYRA